MVGERWFEIIAVEDFWVRMRLAKLDDPLRSSDFSTHIIRPCSQPEANNMPRIPKQARTDGSSTFEPDDFFEKWQKEEIGPPYDNNFRRFIIRSFGLPIDDDYGYQATTEVSLLQAQTYIEFGAQGGLHAWYRDEKGEEVGGLPHPSTS